MFEVRSPFRPIASRSHLVVGILAPFRPLLAEDAAGDHVDLSSCALEDVGHAVDHRFQEREQDCLAVSQTERDLLGPLRKCREGARFRVANGDETVPAQDESDWLDYGIVSVSVGGNEGSHEVPPVLRVEPGGHLDFLHLLARRQAKPEPRFETGFLHTIRVGQIPPDDSIGVRGHRTQAIAGQRICLDHLGNSQLVSRTPTSLPLRREDELCGCRTKLRPQIAAPSMSVRSGKASALRFCYPIGSYGPITSVEADPSTFDKVWRRRMIGSSSSVAFDHAAA